jgi:hypothetical protein
MEGTKAHLENQVEEMEMKMFSKINDLKKKVSTLEENEKSQLTRKDVIS